MSHEKPIRAANGWVVLPGTILIFLGSIALLVLFVLDAVAAEKARQWPDLWLLLGAGLIFGLGLFSCFGYFTLQPNEARVLILFGAYRGTVPAERLALDQSAEHQAADLAACPEPRGREAQGQRQAGQPDRDCRRRGVAGGGHGPGGLRRAAVRGVRQDPERVGRCGTWPASTPTTTAEEHEITLRGNLDEVAGALQKELQERVGKAGVAIEEARLTHLAYAPKIAGVMLRRQQAEAIIDARQKIVHGAVSMVQMALKDLTENEVIQLDEERKAAMVSNLLVVLCGEHDVQPVVNAGTLYSESCRLSVVGRLRADH